MGVVSLPERGLQLELYTRVILKTDKYKDIGASFGCVGYIIDQWDETTYEVEFSDPATGFTYALFAAKEHELESAE
ncbi:DUF4926 domain-containing protein [Bacillus sp. BGMRC 2118]|nr:DUF4926 domain-containing protein [Bacillus sp. BGMRC 2118]